MQNLTILYFMTSTSMSPLFTHRKYSFLNRNSGFTLVELLVVISIVLNSRGLDRECAPVAAVGIVT
ncbi:MAG TPA: hypothetical protein DD622_05965 [Opitutae bacterium]|nr:hypothetical protein [Coraliomargarita sp.]HBO57968.1 hypothetical protein [Opitutae bacterium]